MILKKPSRKSITVIALAAPAMTALLTGAGPAEAYIGPGAGFAFISSFFILFVTLVLGVLVVLFWPFRLIIKALTGKRPEKNGHGVKRVIVVGLDGLDPKLAGRFMDEGKMPNLSRLAESGTFKRLATTLPSMSPVAWSSFITGVDPSRHNIFDFLNRDTRTYMPELSSTRIAGSKRSIKLGRFTIPVGKPTVRLLRHGRPFWSVLGEYGIFSSVIRVPMTFPPEKLHGTLLSAMCVPDLRGTQGTFTHFTSNGSGAARTGGVQVPVEVKDGVIKTHITGPDNHMVQGAGPMRIPMEIRLNGGGTAELRIGKETHRLKTGEFSDWIPLTFRPGLNVKVSGICRFFIRRTDPGFDMYMTPINIDPEKPALPISRPLSYSVYLSKMIGSYATLGLAEDTWALNERVTDEEIFLEQAYSNHREREEMLFNAIDKTRKGLCVCVFDTTDRIQHMFMRFLDDDHPAHAIGADRERYRGVIEELYGKMDDLLGRVMEKTGDGDVVMVISDHGFRQFKRGVNLNAWLLKEGYLALKDGKATGADWFADVDWSRTRAYSFGLAGIYVNEKGRESKGIVPPGEKAALKKEISSRLRGLVDEGTGKVAVLEVYDNAEVYNGPYRDNGPDIFVGYNEGYRNSWGNAVGAVEAEVFMDNGKSWSGDHCMDPRLVPGVFFCNRKITAEKAHIMDIGPTILELFGVRVPKFMTGRPLITERA